MAWIVTLPLGPESQWVLNQELQRFAQVEEAVRQVDQRFAEATQGDPLVEKLLALPGVALVTAVILRAMIGRFDRFRNGKQLSRFCGLTPCNASSGKRQADAGLVNEGNELLRTAMIQLAKRLPGHDARWKELHSRLRSTKPANVATAALANRWLRGVYYQIVPPQLGQPEQNSDLGSGSANGGEPVAPRPHVVLGL